MQEIPELRRLAGPAYLIAALMIVVPAVDLISNMLPLRLSDPAWRYGTVGLGSGFLLTPMLGVLFLALLAGTIGQPTMAKVVGWVNLLLGSLMIPLMILFALDAVQIRNAVQPEALGQFDAGVFKAVFKLLTGALAFTWLGFRGVRTKGQSRRSEAKVRLRSAGRVDTREPTV